jgi:hypothetical protein
MDFFEVKGNDIYEALFNSFHLQLEEKIPITFLGSGTISKVPIKLEIATNKYTHDMGDLTFLSKARFTKLVNQYINRKLYAGFLESCKMKRGKLSSFTFIQPEYEFELNKHTQGGCLIGILFNHIHNNMIVISRTTYIGYMAFIDGALIHKVSEDIGTNPSITWIIFEQQLSYTKSIPFFLSQDYFKTMKFDNKTKNNIILRYDKTVNRTNPKFGPLKRLKKNLIKIDNGVALHSWYPYQVSIL